ncbi:MAG: histidine phosphatase family protein [Roseitalea sp.]|jgi:phosphohistidine phosphatase|nr:histidine phosphatase family protein [Roseitalea sp.]MBO6721762.1 histidine phosphatase family protein [Roseitalea sp.]MBO6741630.1 histidine phosphatase family protein [Roseitalea sp.]
MSRLFLLRHAKAEWAEPGQRDFDRALAASGVEDAKALAAAMVEQALLPAQVICSSAARARQTLDAINTVHDFSAVTRYDQNLYATDAPGYLEVAASSGVDTDLMLVGHNPMLEDVAIALASSGDEALVDDLQMGFRTSGLAVIALDGPIADIEKLSGRLETYLTPATS